MAIVLHVLQARAFGLDPHIDIFRHETDECARIVRTQSQRNVDNPIVVGLILVGIEKRHLGIFGYQLIGKNCQRAESVFIKVGPLNIHALLDLLGGCVTHHFIDELNSDSRLATDTFVSPVLDMVELL